MKDEEALQAVFSRASGVLINLDESAPPATYALPAASSSTEVAERPTSAENTSADPSGLNRAMRPAPPDVAGGNRYRETGGGTHHPCAAGSVDGEAVPIGVLAIQQC